MGLISYGGTAGGLRSVEQLRLVLGELQLVAIRTALSFHNMEPLFDETGALREPERSNAAVEGFLAQLTWWAHTLRDGRKNRPMQGLS